MSPSPSLPIQSSPLALGLSLPRVTGKTDLAAAPHLPLPAAGAGDAGDGRRLPRPPAPTAPPVRVPALNPPPSRLPLRPLVVLCYSLFVACSDGDVVLFDSALTARVRMRRRCAAVP